ncbi:LuxR C-terminal-related transcriptional regulator [Noviherbaspirillum aridicola]|nr:LuxR C-terminal-related transcriptional regulator [Noviherbaspirillum aridicola]
MAVAQLSLDLSQPINHHDRLHASPHGAVLYWEARKSENRWTKVMPGDPVAQVISCFAGSPDTYLTVNQFFHWRNVRQLKSLRACYVDIDGMMDLEAALDALHAAKMPAPSFAVYSGRGLHLYWPLSPTPAKALPVWQRVQDAIVAALAPLGADPKARDCARVLRLVGTVNAKNGAEVRGVVLTDAVWTMHELADEVLGTRDRMSKTAARTAPKMPVHQAEMFDFKAGAARKGKASPRTATGSIYDWWHLVYQDLVAICEHHWFGGVAPGHRDQVLFLMAVSLSWFAHTDILEDEIMRTAQTFTPTLLEKEVRDQMAPIIERARAAHAGETVLWRGLQVDPRYRFKADTLREWMGDLIAPELHDQLRCLAPADVIKARKKERDSKRDRVAEGRYQQNREAYLGDVQQRAVSARLMHAQGVSMKEIAAKLDISAKTVSRYLKEAGEVDKSALLI